MHVKNSESDSSKRQTKIVATLGPSSDTQETIKALLDVGVNVFRLNFSHGEHKTHEQSAKMIRDLEAQTGRPIGIIADLQGPKLRIGTFENDSIDLKTRQRFRFDSDPAPGNNERVNLPHPEVMSVLEEGSLIFLDDGKVRARIIKKAKDYVEAEIKSGQTLSNKKGLNVPGALIPLEALTYKDKTDLEAALGMGVDWIAQSFVQTPDDVRMAKDLIKGRAGLIAKIEKPSALAQLDDIIKLCDAVMLARGDLGVEIPPEDVPAVQKRVVRQVRLAGKPVIVATQMLESMIKSARPTRAEASDVATAVYDGTDAVMLSAETAAGDHPLKAVEMMDRICLRTEADETYIQMMEADRPDAVGTPSDAITTAAHYIAEDIDAAAIVNYTMSGSTALRTARQRPDVPILCLTPDINVARKLTLSYGVHAIHEPETVEDFTGPARHAAAKLVEHNLVQSGERFVMTAGMPFGVAGTTNILRIAKVE